MRAECDCMANQPTSGSFYYQMSVPSFVICKTGNLHAANICITGRAPPHLLCFWGLPKQLGSVTWSNKTQNRR